MNVRQFQPSETWGGIQDERDTAVTGGCRPTRWGENWRGYPPSSRRNRTCSSSSTRPLRVDLTLARIKEWNLVVWVSATASALMPPASLTCFRGLEPRRGSGAATPHATSTRWLYAAAALRRRKHDRTHLLPDPPRPPPALNAGTRPQSFASTCGKMTHAVLRRRAASPATGSPGIEHRPPSWRFRSPVPAST